MLIVHYPLVVAVHLSCLKNSLQHLIGTRSTPQAKTSHYLDDFFFVHKSKDKCLHLLCTFQNACDFVGFPYSQDKTFLPTTKLEYLCILIDTEEMLLKIPENKRRSILDTINHLLTRRCCKVCEIQSICGSLNFLNRIVRVGKPFERRLYDLTIGKKPHHHTPINAEAKKDLLMWRRFLFDFNCLRPIPSFRVVYNDQIRFFTDASAKLGNGLGCSLDGEWCFTQWSEDFLSESPNIALLELLAIIMAILLWGERLVN